MQTDTRRCSICLEGFAVDELAICHGRAWCSLKCLQSDTSTHERACIDAYFKSLDDPQYSGHYKIKSEDDFTCEGCKETSSAPIQAILCFGCRTPRWCSSPCARIDDHIPGCIAEALVEMFHTNDFIRRSCVACRKSELFDPDEDVTSFLPCSYCSEKVWCSRDCFRRDTNHAIVCTGIKETQEKHPEEAFKYTAILVSDATKDKIFADVLREAKLELEGGSELIRRIKSLDSTIADKFEPKSIAINQMPLRLLCEESLRDDEIKSFIAISYCWHSDDWKVHDALEEWAGSPLTKPMLASIMQELRQPGEGVWIDQMCINQQDAAEKQVVISSMDVIYRAARKVVIVLEDVSIPVDLWEDCQPIFGEGGLIDGNVDNAKLHMSFISNIFSARWFTRAWCVHEFLTRQDALLLFSVSTGRIIGCSLQQLVRVTGTCFNRFHQFKSNRNVVKVMACLMSLRGSMEEEASLLSHGAPHGINLLNIFSRCSVLGCSIDADRMSIFLNIARLGISYKSPGPCSLSQRIYEFALLAIADGEIDILARPDLIGETRNEGNRISSLPWAAIEPVIYRIGTLHSDPTPRVSAADISIRFSKSEMEVDVLVLAGIAIAEPNDEVVAASTQFLQSQTGQEILAEIAPGPVDQSRVSEIKISFAVALSYGAVWILNFFEETRPKMWPVVLNTGSESLERVRGIPMKLAVDTVHQLLSDDLKNEDGTDRSDIDLEKLRLAVLWLIQLLYCMKINYTSMLLLDNRDPNLLGLCSMSWSDYERYGEDVVIVVPTMMTAPCFALHHRLWVLKRAPQSTGTKYRIVSKHVMFGFGEITEHLPSRIIRKQLPIIGATASES